MNTNTFILPHGKPALITFIERLPDEKKWKVDIGPFKKKRSNAQNAALFGVAYKDIREATGNDVDDLHTMFCGDFFGWVECEVLGKRKMKPRRTTTTNEAGKRDVISTNEFMDFYEEVQRKAAEFGIYVRSPNE